MEMYRRLDPSPPPPRWVHTKWKALYKRSILNYLCGCTKSLSGDFKTVLQCNILIVWSHFIDVPFSLSLTILSWGRVAPCTLLSASGHTELSYSLIMGRARSCSKSTRPAHLTTPTLPAPTSDTPKPETLYRRDGALLYIAFAMLIWAAPIPAVRWHCSLWP